MKNPLRLLSFLAAGFALTAIAPALQAQKLVIKGSDTLGAKLVPTIAEDYRALNPGRSFEIAAEGSSTGIAALISGTADIGMSSRRARPAELSNGAAKGVTLRPLIVCYDGIAIIVNAANPITTLTKRQVEQVFTGDLRSWDDLGSGAASGPISIYTRNTASGTYADFKALAMNKRDYAPSSQKLAGNEQIVAEVAANPNGIGYVGLAYINAPGVKVVAIEGDLPSKESVLANRYPYARPNFFYTNGEPQGEAARFIDYVLSEAGQQVVERVGFVPVR
ncbi:phosphate-binding protein [Cephaloticoccus capnophilus]|uniref:Phosphate-binding protein n=1 Tax=Cephaloticoccus capnophilus TaxID=1548208 RepID=A0A139SKI2_9BACT|nr:phosphate ABC transporter substrate-binding protein [Cephaloticoccus capnophilus]KXU35030.1 phosphate-binding protein [Cephaloticoccus capnophilus]